MKEYLGRDKTLYAAFMDLEKAHDMIELEALRSVLKIYGVGGPLLKGTQAIHREGNACVRVGREFGESSAVKAVRHGQVMSPWLFNIYMDGCMMEMKWKTVNVVVQSRLNEEV